MRPVQGKTTLKRSRIHGWGVFATKAIRAGEVVEQMPALAIKNQHINGHGWKSPNSPLVTHAYEPDGLQEVWIATGTSSFFNHSDTPNASFHTLWGTIDGAESGDWIVIWAERGIKKGEEITLSYLEGSDA